MTSLHTISLHIFEPLVWPSCGMVLQVFLNTKSAGLAVDRETLRTVCKPEVSPSSALLWLQGTPEAA